MITVPAYSSPWQKNQNAGSSKQVVTSHSGGKEEWAEASTWLPFSITVVQNPRQGIMLATESGLFLTYNQDFSLQVILKPAS